MENKFKVEDRVKCIKTSSVFFGKIGTIQIDDRSGIPYRVKYGSGEYEFDWHREDDITLAEKEEYKVGDVVRLVSKRPDNWNFAGEMDEFLGTVQRIRRIKFEPGKNRNQVWFVDVKTNGWVFFDDSIECIVDPETIPEAVQVNLIEEEREELKKTSNEFDNLGGIIEKSIVDNVIPLVEKRIIDNLGDLTKRVTTVAVKVNDEEIKETVLQAHKQFKNVLTLINNKIPVMLVGAAGSGKTRNM